VHVNVNANHGQVTRLTLPRCRDELPSGVTGPAMIRSPSQEPCRDVPIGTDGFAGDDIASTRHLCFQVIAVCVVVISKSICVRIRFERATRAM
jgi:hypothetical protein